MPRDRTLAYIAGTGRCGSTVLSLALDTHADVIALGEMHSSRSRECSCGRRVDECRFMRELVQRLAWRGVALDPADWSLEYSEPRNRLLDRFLFQSLRYDILENARDVASKLVPAYRRMLEDLDRKIEQFIATALDIKGASVFVDASKHPIRIRHLTRLRGYRLKVIHLVRDPRGVTYSYRQRGANGMAKVPRDWSRLNLGVERQLRLLPTDSWVRVRYESLCADPRATLTMLGDFLGVGPIPVPASLREPDHHLQNGNAARKQSDTRRTIEIDERWRTELPEDIRAIAARVAGPLARRYGYPEI